MTKWYDGIITKITIMKPYPNGHKNGLLTTKNLYITIPLRLYVEKFYKKHLPKMFHWFTNSIA